MWNKKWETRLVFSEHGDWWWHILSRSLANDVKKKHPFLTSSQWGVHTVGMQHYCSSRASFKSERSIRELALKTNKPISKCVWHSLKVQNIKTIVIVKSTNAHIIKYKDLQKTETKNHPLGKKEVQGIP